MKQDMFVWVNPESGEIVTGETDSGRQKGVKPTESAAVAWLENAFEEDESDPPLELYEMSTEGVISFGKPGIGRVSSPASHAAESSNGGLFA